MSIAVLIAVHDGLVLAADSASTLTVATPGGLGVANVYDNANKIFNLVKGEPMGCVTFGSGSIGSASIGTLIKDFRKKLTHPKAKDQIGFDLGNYKMERVSQLLGSFLSDECTKLKEAALQKNTNIGLFVGGYSSGESLGEGWAVEIREGTALAPVKLREKQETGITWGGQDEVLKRMILGFSSSLFEILAQISQPPGNPQEVERQLAPLLISRLQAQLVFAPMPIQDAIDLGKFLVHSAIMYSRFLPGAQVVGGPIEVSAITKHEGFKWISRKHYYDQSLNKEPIHVICDEQRAD